MRVAVAGATPASTTVLARVAIKIGRWTQYFWFQQNRLSLELIARVLRVLALHAHTTTHWALGAIAYVTRDTTSYVL